MEVTISQTNTRRDVSQILINSDYLIKLTESKPD